MEASGQPHALAALCPTKQTTVRIGPHHMYKKYQNRQKCNYIFNFEVFCIIFNSQYALLIMEMYFIHMLSYLYL
jgi:hypothetical protein